MIFPKMRMTMIILAAVIVAMPISAHAETLADALADAYKQNPDLLAKRASLRATDEGVAAALSGYRPTVEISGSAGHSQIHTDTNSGTDKTRDLNPRGAELSVTQPVFRGFRTTAAVARAENDVLAEQSELRGTEQTVLLDAATAYMDVVRDRAVLELNKNNQKVLERQLKATRDRFEVGELTKTDVAQAESRMERARAAVITAEGVLASSQTKFQKVVGRMPSADLTAPDIWPNLPSSRAEALTLAEKQNPSVLAADYREKSARHAVDEVRGEELPEVKLRGSAASDWNKTSSGDQVDSLSVLAELSIPFYQGGAVMARTRAAQQTQNQYLLLRDSAVRSAAQLAGTAFDDLSTARANIDAYNAAIKAAEVALNGVRQEQEVGSRTILDVLDAEQELLDSQSNLVRAKRDEIVAAYNLLAAVGQLTAESMKLPVEFYDPERHLKNSKTKWYGYSIE